jgi:hypothetical protein
MPIANSVIADCQLPIADLGFAIVQYVKKEEIGNRQSAIGNRQFIGICVICGSG